MAYDRLSQKAVEASILVWQVVPNGQRWAPYFAAQPTASEKHPLWFLGIMGKDAVSRVVEIVGPTGSGKTWFASRYSRNSSLSGGPAVYRDRWLLTSKDGHARNRRLESITSVVPHVFRRKVGKVLFPEANWRSQLKLVGSEFSDSFLNWCLNSGVNAFSTPAEHIEWAVAFWRVKEVRDYIEWKLQSERKRLCLIDESLAFRPGNGSIELLLDSGWYLQYLEGLPRPGGIILLQCARSDILRNLEERRRSGTLPFRLVSKNLDEIERDIVLQQELTEIIHQFFVTKKVPVLELEAGISLRGQSGSLEDFFNRL